MSSIVKANNCRTTCLPIFPVAPKTTILGCEGIDFGPEISNAVSVLGGGRSNSGRNCGLRSGSRSGGCAWRWLLVLLLLLLALLVPPVGRKWRTELYGRDEIALFVDVADSVVASKAEQQSCADENVTTTTNNISRNTPRQTTDPRRRNSTGHTTMIGENNTGRILTGVCSKTARGGVCR